MYVIMGATGNIGSKLANILLDKREKVKVIGRSAEQLKPFVDRGAATAVGEVSNVGFLTHDPNPSNEGALHPSHPLS
ncbi:MAG TPA: hypothetical protein EYM83_04535 [Nitrospirales bacterium]|nr:hypothetical protein [Nitrospirales bacterium]